MAGPGFKIADGYVEVHARYDKGELQRAAQDAADDHDAAFNKEREKNAKSGDTRATNRRIGGLASRDFVRGVQEQVRRQKASPFISVDDVRRDSTRLGQIHVREFGRGVEQEVDRRRGIFRRIGARISRHIGSGLSSRESVGNVAAAFFTRFIETVSFGQADIGMSRLGGPMAKSMAKIGAVLGVGLATALVTQIANGITALLPVALGGALLAVPIADLIFRNVSLEKGKLSFEKNEIGKALKGFIRQAQELSDALGRAFSGPFLAGLESATRLFEAIEKPMTRAVRAISPGALAMWNGLLGAIVSFGKAFQPALKGINAGLKEWGRQLPIIGKVAGQAFADMLKNPELVRKAVQALSGALQFLIRVFAGLVTGLTYALGAWNSLNMVIRNSKFLDADWAQSFHRFSEAWKPLKAAILGVWEAFKKFATATNDKQATERLRALVERIKAVWKPLKAFLAEVWRQAWDKIKEIWNTKVKPWVDGTLKPWLERNLKKAAKAAFAAMGDAAKAELKKLPGKAMDALKSLGPKISSMINSAKDKAVAKVKDLVSRAVAFLKTLPGKAGSAVSSLWSRMAGSFSSAVSRARTAASNLVNGFMRIITQLPGKARAAAARVKGAVVGALAGAGSWLVGAGRSMMQGLANGISAGLSWVAGAARRVAQAAVSAAKSALGIRSPSRVFAEEVGKPSAQGIAVGIEKNLPKDIPGLRAMARRGRPAYAAAGGGSSSVSNTWNPTLQVHISEGLNPINAGARRALIRELFLELEQYRKDFVR